MKKWIVVLVASMFVLSACNTVKGLGSDVKKTGEKIEGTSQRHGAN